ncbi:MAG: methylated-DNA--[protein]-cysteine S-methyltransferase [Chloroflexi bacterium]|nr:methylated-DNA--[protein]-cysteine S-methyltransferase [Chloroflexota bacterium]
MAWYDTFDTDLGTLFVGGSDAGVHRIDFLTPEHDLDVEIGRLEADCGETVAHDTDAARPAVEALTAWFVDADSKLDLRLAPRGTSFQQRVWEALRAIPCGATTSYGEIALDIGQPGAARAVGGAVGRNPISVVVPCHRVIAADGSLGGFASGLDRKRWLLRHEGAAVRGL